MLELPISILNDIFQIASQMHGYIWYLHVSEKGEAKWKYNPKNKRMSVIRELYRTKSNNTPLFQRTILRESKLETGIVEEENPEEKIYHGFSHIMGESNGKSNGKIYVYKSFENKRKKENVFLFLVYNVEGYTQEYNRLERGVLYKDNKEYEIVTYTLFYQLRLGDTYYPNLGLCVYCQ